MPTNKITAIISGIVLAIISTIIFFSVLNLGILVALILGFIIGAVVSIGLLARSRGEKPQDVAKEVINEAIKPVSQQQIIEDKLLNLNLEIRLKTGEQDLIAASEDLIDQFLDLLPKAMTEAPDTEATFDLEQLASQYMPQLINQFLSLGENDQKQQKATLLEQINEMKQTLEQAKQALDQGNLHDFKVSSEFIRAKTQ